MKLGRLLQLLASLVGLLSTGAMAVVAVGLVAMMLLVVVEVVARQGFRWSTLLSQEFAGYLLMLTAFLGMAYTFKTGGHVRIRLVISRLPRKVQDWLEFIMYILGLVVVVVLTRDLWKVFGDSFRYQSRSQTAIEFLEYIPQSVMVIGAALLGLQMLTMFFQKLASLIGPGIGPGKGPGEKGS